MLKPSSFDRNFYGCPRCDWPLDHNSGEYEDTGGVTCPCGVFVPLPEMRRASPQPKQPAAEDIEKRKD
jgi:hypothetical protein